MITNLIKVFEVCCPKCGKVERLFKTKSHSEKVLRRLGWQESRDHVWYCPKCKDREIEK